MACITGALWAKRGERAILRETPGDCESRDEGGRMFRAWRKLLRLPRLAHKAPVMQALKPCLYEYLGRGGGGIESVRTNGVSVLSGLNLGKM